MIQVRSVLAQYWVDFCPVSSSFMSVFIPARPNSRPDNLSMISPLWTSHMSSSCLRGSLRANTSNLNLRETGVDAGLGLLCLLSSLSKHLHPLQVCSSSSSHPHHQSLQSTRLFSPDLHVPFENEMQKKAQKRQIPVKDTSMLFHRCYFWPPPEGGCY